MTERIPWAPYGVIIIVICTLATLTVLKREQEVEVFTQKDRGLYSDTLAIAPKGLAAVGSVTDAKAYREEWRSERDLYAQEAMAYWTRWVTLATGAGVIVATFSLGLLWIAAVYARRAADAGQRAANIAERSQQLLERAYIIPGQLSRISTPKGRHASVVGINYKIGNYGRAPAIIHYVYSTFGPTPSCHPGEPESGVTTFRHDEVNNGNVLAANTIEENPHWGLFPGVMAIEYELTRKIKRVTYNEQLDVYFAIHIKFEDMAGEVHVSRFLWRYDQISQRFFKFGGPEYNYERPATNS